MRSHRQRRRAPAVALAAVVVVAATVWLAPGPAAAETEYRKGPDPTEASVTAPLGPFATASVSVPASVAGFGGGVIHYPTDTGQGTFGAVAVAPGFLGSSANYGWMGPRIASQGFVVLLINTNSRLDNPASRGDQLLAALDYLVTTSSVRSRIDASRLAVAGHSMGGGGTLEAATDRPALQAAVPLQPWHTVKAWPNVAVPTMIIGADGDTTAPVASHAEPFYESIPAVSEKAYLELADSDHREASEGTNVTQAKFVTVWLKRYVDNDTRYEQFICPPPVPSAAIEEYRGTCPG